jgi:hypothetical protein
MRKAAVFPEPVQKGGDELTEGYPYMDMTLNLMFTNLSALTQKHHGLAEWPGYNKLGWACTDRSHRA